NRRLLVRSHAFAIDVEVRVVERRVAQPVAEGEQRRDRLIHVACRVLAQVRIRGASRRVSRVKQGNGAARARKCGGQSSPGRYLPEDDIGDRWTGLDAEHPCLEY